MLVLSHGVLDILTMPLVSFALMCPKPGTGDRFYKCPFFSRQPTPHMRGMDAATMPAFLRRSSSTVVKYGALTNSGRVERE